MLSPKQFAVLMAEKQKNQGLGITPQINPQHQLGMTTQEHNPLMGSLNLSHPSTIQTGLNPIQHAQSKFPKLFGIIKAPKVPKI